METRTLRQNSPTKKSFCHCLAAVVYFPDTATEHGCSASQRCLRKRGTEQYSLAAASMTIRSSGRKVFSQPISNSVAILTSLFYCLKAKFH